MENAFSKRNLKNYLAIFLGITAAQGLGASFVSSFLSFTYTEYFAVPIAIVSVVLSIGVVVDGFSDFVMGIVIDRVKTKHGKIKHWFLWMAVPMALTTALLFTVPINSPTVFKVIWLFTIYNLFNTAVTAVRLPANTMPAVISKNEKVRTIGGFMIAIAATLCSMVTNAVTVPTIAFLGDGVVGYRNFAIILAILTLIFCLAAYFLTTEEKYTAQSDSTAVEHNHKGTNLTIWQQIKYLLKNKYWVISLGMTVPFNIGAGVIMGCAAYFCEFILHDLGFFGVYMTVIMIATTIGTVFWMPFCQKLDARQLFIINAILGIIGYGMTAASLLVMENNTMVFLIGSFIVSFGDGINCDLAPTLTARVVDYGEYVHHERQEGLCFSGKTVVQKVVSALCTAILGFALAGAGYVSGYFPESAGTCLIILLTVVPTVAYVLMLVSSCAFKLDRAKMDEINEELERRRQAASN